MDHKQRTVTITLKAPHDGSLDSIMPFLQAGAPVAIGRGLAVIESVEIGQAAEQSSSECLAVASGM